MAGFGFEAHASVWFSAFLEVVHFRALPFVGYLLLSRSVRVSTKVVSFSLFAAATCACLFAGVTPEQLFVNGAAVLYVFVLGCLVQRLAERFWQDGVSAGGVLVLCGFGFMVLPGIVLAGAANAVVLTLGWEAMLAAYSYTIEGRSPGAEPAGRPKLADCLFFLLVNPTLVYVERGTQVSAAGWHARGAARLALGLFSTWLALGLAMVDVREIGVRLGMLAGYPAFVLHGVYFFVARYAALSGLASAQIGAMRLLGYQIPERYHYPFLALSPSDFWRRWNTYVGGWFQRYLFVPLAVRLGQRLPVRGRAGTALSGVLTLIAIGLFHDLFAYLGPLSTRLGGTLGFALAALSLLVWLGAGRVLSLAGGALDERMRARGARVAGAVSRIAVAHAAFLVIWTMFG